MRNETTGESRESSTDGQGKFKLEGLPPASYKLTLRRDGFKVVERSISIEPGKATNLEIKFEIAETRAELTVTTKGTLLPNSDPNYRALRDGELVETFEITGLTLQRDVGTIKLNNGRISFLAPVLGKTVIGIFTGDGEFTLTPLLNIEKRYLKLITEKESVNEAFDRLVICFSDNTYQEIKAAGKESAPEARARDVLKEFRNRMHRNTDRPRSFIEALYSGEDAENVEALLLGYLYNPKRALSGKKKQDVTVWYP